MKKITWKKHHKWFGLLICFFMLMFCVSGIVLNHRSLVSGCEVSRKWLPGSYHLKNWNGGLLRGTTAYTAPDSSRHVLLYGNNGIWQTDSTAHSFTDFCQGFPRGADSRNLRSVVQMTDGTLVAVSPSALYRHNGKEWAEVTLPKEAHERLTDAAIKGDTLVVAGRSHLYISLPPYQSFHPLTLKSPAGYNGKVSLFRTVWLLHSGELFGVIGKLVVDVVAIVFILLCITGVIYWLMPGVMRRLRRAGQAAKGSARLLATSLRWHNSLGRYLFVLLLFITFTGWCLRPPVLIALAQGKVPAIPGTVLHSSNAWNDKLRMLRYDDAGKDWIISTSEGFYSLSTLESVPVKINDAPPVSVMGLNVWEKDVKGRWLAGSFSGMYVWDRMHHRSTDYFTGKEAEHTAGPPFGLLAVSGYSDDFGKPVVVEYVKGSDFAPMPAEFAWLPMSLWNLCLEIHSGRIYTFLGQGTAFYVFFAGLAVMWCLWTGWRIRLRKRGRNR